MAFSPSSGRTADVPDAVGLRDSVPVSLATMSETDPTGGPPGLPCRPLTRLCWSPQSVSGPNPRRTVVWWMEAGTGDFGQSQVTRTAGSPDGLRTRPWRQGPNRKPGGNGFRLMPGLRANSPGSRQDSGWKPGRPLDPDETDGKSSTTARDDETAVNRIYRSGIPRFLESGASRRVTASISTKAMTQVSVPLLDQAWLVPRWMTTSPAVRWTSSSSRSMSISP